MYQKILIENYKGWDIFFNRDIQMFYTLPTQYLSEQTKCSTFDCVKKFIDKYTKANRGFKPIAIERYPPLNGVRILGQLVGRTEDDRFLYKTENGEIKMLNAHEENNWFLIDPNNNSNLEEIRLLNNEIDEMRKGMGKITEKITAIKGGMDIEDVTKIRRRLFLGK